MGSQVTPQFKSATWMTEIRAGQSLTLAWCKTEP